MGKRIPILLIHGFTSSGQAWDASKDAIGGDSERTCVVVFDYGAAATEWVTNSAIGAKLASSIIGLADRSAAQGGLGKLVVVAHSMGGLAIQCATDVTCGGDPIVADKLLDVIMLGTPSHGTWLKAHGGSLLADAIGLEAQDACRGAWRLLPKLCDLAYAFLTSPAAAAFTPGSGQLSALASLPDTVPVYAVAGSVKIEYPVFGWQARIGDAGDLIVSEESALAAAHIVGQLGGEMVIDCGSVLLGYDPFRGFQFSLKDKDCWHGGEPNADKFVMAIQEQIQTAVETLEPQQWLYSAFKSADAGGPSGGRRQFISQRRLFSNSTSFWVGCEGRPATTTFVVGQGSTQLHAILTLDPAITPSNLTVDVQIGSPGQPPASWTLRVGDLVTVDYPVTSNADLTVKAIKTAGDCSSSAVGYAVAADAAIK